MNEIEENLSKYNITIPKPTSPIANYSPFVIAKNLVFISGQIPLSNGELVYKGKVGKDLDIASAKKLQKYVCLTHLQF